MSKNPHPDAGKPGKHVEVGAIYECIPCNRKALHGWSVRATQAESKVSREIVEALEAKAVTCSGLSRSTSKRRASFSIRRVTSCRVVSHW